MKKICVLANVFISKKLLKTLKDLNIPTYAMEGAQIRHKLRFLTKRKAVKNIRENKNLLIYTNAEDVLHTVHGATLNENIKAGIEMYKDKWLLQDQIKDYYPEVYFIRISRQNLKKYKVPKHKHIVIKPLVGFHSVGIRKIKNQREFDREIPKILEEVSQFSDVFSGDVLDDKWFLVTDFQGGTEYACDAYFDSKGNPVILGIYQHEFKDENDNRDLLYWTSAELMCRMVPNVMNYLHMIQARTRKITNFPIHFEFREHDHKLYMIEINPMRFGGFGLADLSEYAFGVNAYKAYFNQEKPHWENICQSTDKNVYGFVLGRREHDELKTKKVAHKKFRATFKHVMRYQPIDHARYSLFAVVLCKAKTTKELRKYLTMDHNKFFY